MKLDARQPTVHTAWGAVGLENATSRVSAIVVIDVLSFTTSVSIAATRGINVFPCDLNESAAQQLAARVGAELAVSRFDISAERPWSLSPASMVAAPYTTNLVLPSPNGAAISRKAASVRGAVVVAASLRNAAAVAQWLAANGFGQPGRELCVVASGERWPDNSLRPALEDLLGVGCVLGELRHRTSDSVAAWSPEARAAATVYSGMPDLYEAIADSESGIELRERGYADDVELACELNADTAVPVLSDDAYRNVAAH